jgi:DNA repair protein RadA/Sms
VIGWDQNRLAMVLAVLDAHCRVRLGDCDVYLNVAGGLRIGEPAADLAVAAALVSSRLNVALPADCVYFGEISLSGSIRPVSHAPARLKEAQKLGFGRAVLPRSALGGDRPAPELGGVDQLVDLVAGIAATARRADREAAGEGS